MTTAISVPDKFLARSIAQTFPSDSIERLRFEARIEYADGNRSKALEKAERALQLKPDNNSLKSLREKIAKGTLDPLKDGLDLGMLGTAYLPLLIDDQFLRARTAFGGSCRDHKGGSRNCSRDPP
jgi:hypothetical protein